MKENEMKHKNNNYQKKRNIHRYLNTKRKKKYKEIKEKNVDTKA